MKFTEEFIVNKALKEFRDGNAAFDIGKNDCVLLVIDMQDEFVKPGWTSSWIPEATRQVPAIRKIIEECRNLNVPVIYTVFSATNMLLDRPKYGSTMPNRFLDIAPEKDWFTEGHVWHELAPRKDEIVIHKCSYGAFYDTPLETILKNMEKNTIIISGTLTNCCCGTTARQGYERGFKVVFGSDITSTYTQEMQDAELGILRFAFAKVMTCQEIIDELEK
jgi:nicotinamidase-related amidase